MCVQQGPLILGKQEVGIDFDLSIYFDFEPKKIVLLIFERLPISKIAASFAVFAMIAQ